MGIQIACRMMAFLVLMTGFAGFVDSAAGGGGLISLPAYLFAGLPPHYTYATNKFSAACGTTFATASFFQNGAMNVKVGVLAAIGSFAGSALGAHIVLLLSDEVLRTMMFIILPIAAVVILWRRNLPDENRDDGTMNLKKTLLALGIGLGIGLYDGMVGPGTGTFAIIAFTSLMGFDLRTANGNAKVLNLASNYASPALPIKECQTKGTGACVGADDAADLAHQRLGTCADCPPGRSGWAAPRGLDSV